MRVLFTLLLLCGLTLAQDAQKTGSLPKLTQAPHSDANTITIPAGTKIPIALKNTISTKANHEGDPIYAESTFPVVVNDKIIVHKEGTIQGDSNKGKTAATIAAPAAEGTLAGAVKHGGEGALIGAGIGGAVGTAIAALTHGNEVKMGPGTTLEVVLQRDVVVDGSRIAAPASARRD